MSCKWEYKTITITGVEQKARADFLENSFFMSDKDMNELGTEGWELVDVYEKLETVHPNFGDDRYTTGIQPNVRTSEINFVFKRRKW